METTMDKTAVLTEEIGERLRAVRLDCRFSKDKLANGLGITVQQVQKYEDGRNNISVSMLILMCAVLGVHPMEIIGIIVQGRVNVRKKPDIAQKRLHLAQDRLEEICREILGAKSEIQ